MVARPIRCPGSSWRTRPLVELNRRQISARRGVPRPRVVAGPPQGWSLRRTGDWLPGLVRAVREDQAAMR
ncbi:hypothetical protein AW168_40875 [Nocardia brasiliensis]|nr:hypothetical protein AW168_40875 [Nocardia brasiliensis]